MTADPIPKFTAEQINDLTNRIVTNVTFFAFEKGDLDAFMVISAMLKPEDVPENCMTFYEDYAKAGPMSVNGKPTFFSLQMFPKESWDDLVVALDAKQKALNL